MDHSPNESVLSPYGLEEDARNSARDLMLVLKRRFPLFLTVVVGLVAGTTILALALPPVYRSSGTILIEQQEIPPDLVRSTVTSYADQRIQTISQRVMTTTNLRGIVEKYDLYSDLRKEQPDEVVLEEMREDIGMEIISAEVVDPRSGRPQQATIAFQVSYESTSPQAAQRVANELTSLYLDENIKTRTEMASETAGFLEDEVKRLATSIELLESELASFKEIHADALPEMKDVNLQIRERLERDLRETELRLNGLTERLMELEAAKAALDPQKALFGSSGQRIPGPADRLSLLEMDLLSTKARYSDDHPSVARLTREIEALKQELGVESSNSEWAGQLEAARAELAVAEKQYTGAHPTVVDARKRVAELEAAIPEQAEQGVPAKKSDGVPPTNPQYIQREAQLAAAQAELQGLRNSRSTLLQRIEAIEQSLRKTPQVEREYRTLVRDYENAVKKYQEVRGKQLEAELAQTLEQERKGERFNLIEPPLMPERPVKPNRILLLLVGLFLSVLVGLATVALLESLDDALYGPKSVTRSIGTPPLAVIPYIHNRADATRKYAKFGVAGIVALVLLIGAAIFIQIAVMPLDVFLLTVMRRFGL